MSAVVARRPARSRNFLPALGWAALLAALVAAPLGLGGYFVQVGSELLIFSIFAMSLDLLLGYTGLMSFGHAAFFGLGAYTLCILGTTWDVSPWLGLAAGVVVAALGAAIIGFFCVRIAGVAFLMLTMAFSQLIYSGAMRWRGLTGGSDGMAGPDRPEFFGFSLDDTLVMYYVALVGFVVSFVFLRALLDSPLGHAFVGIRENEPRMRAIGYRTRRYKLLCFTIGGALAGFSGGLYAIFNDFISPDSVHWSASGDVLVMVTLGGAGTLVGPVIGTAAFLLLKYLVSAESRHWLLIIGLVFIACVMFFPKGLYGTARQIWRRRA